MHKKDEAVLAVLEKTVLKGSKLRFCVVGAGNGGMAMAGHLGFMGFPVSLYNRTDSHLAGVRWHGGIELDGEVKGFGRIALASSDMGEAVDGADVVMVITPSTAHAGLAGIMSPHLKDGQIVLLNPGRTGGALEFHKILFDSGLKTKPLIAEAQTFIYASRATSRHEAKIFRIKNAGWIEETNGAFDYYLQGITPSVALVLERIDAERLDVARALGVRSVSAREWLYLSYDSPGANLYEAIHNTESYRGIKAPPTIAHRYIWEDVPMSLVPLSSIGTMLGVPTPTIDMIIELGSLLHGKDYRAEGRTVEKMGIAGLSVKEIHRMVADSDELDKHAAKKGRLK